MTYLLIIILCIAINAGLSAFEMGLVSIKRASLKMLIEKGSGQARELLTMRENLERTLSTLQVGITIVAIISGTMVGKLTDGYGRPWFERLGLSPAWAETSSVLLFVMVVTFFTVVFGELVPKSIATKYPTFVSFSFAKVIRFLTFVFYPVVSQLEGATLAVLRLLEKLDVRPQRPDLEDADRAFAIHKLPKRHREFVFNLVNMQKLTLQDVLLSWEKVVKIDYAFNRAQVLKLFIDSGHTRAPVIKQGRVEGLLNAKEFLSALDEDWHMLVRPMIVVKSEDKPLNTLRHMQAKKSHMSIVVEEAGATPLGIVTIEDILEQVVGDIYDEDDLPPVSEFHAKRR